MKKIYSLIYCLVTLLLASCTNESLTDSSEGKTIQSLNASMADLTMSRSHLENGTSVVWDEGDVLGVFSDTQEQAVPYYYNGDGSTFSGNKIRGNVFYAFYPYAEFTPEGSRIMTTLEKEFQYKENTYSRRCPMVAMSTDNNFQFLQTCGIVKLSLTGTWRLSRIILKGNNNEILAGTGTIDAASDAPILTIPADAGDASNSLLMHTGITLNKDIPTEFYFIVPVQTFTQGLTFTITGYAEGSFAETTVTKSTNQPIEVSRAIVKSFTAIDADDLLAEETKDDRTALMALYNSLGGAEWTNHENWGSNKPLSQWHGVEVENDHVTGLYLSDNNLTGEIPPEIGNLTSLKRLYINYNNIRGVLPASMDNLKNLEYIYFNNNNLSGDIPAGISGLPCWVTSGWINVIQEGGYHFTFSTLNLSVPSFTQPDLMTQNTVNSNAVMQEKELVIVYLWRSDFNYLASTLKELYKRYKNHGLNILGISDEENESTAKDAITANGMEEWYHVSRKNMGYDSWGFYIPTVALFDKTGNLLFYNYYQDIDTDLPTLIRNKLGEGEDLYASSDFSEDGEYVTLQTASEGNGIDIVLMGDAYSDRLIKDGTYESVMRKACEAFFSEQPYTDFRHLFNVHYVKVVSVNEEYREGSANTAFSCYFGEGTRVGGNDNKCSEYAKKVPGMTDEKLNNTLIIVMMNSTRYAGTCYMYWNYGWTTDYGEGKAIAYFPVGESDEALASVLHHEAGGHGFGKLADEYFYDSSAPADKKQELQSLAPLGWHKNVDITSDPAAVHWSKFIIDAAYTPERIGVYEGGATYAKGIYRPTETSIMRYNIGGFNAPSREMIYYRIHKLAYGADWVYDYNAFKNWDAKNIREHATRAVMAAPKNFVPLAPPVIKVIR
ncbi:M64 family metallopeptidase [Parabacteroides pacaensis]|uniref:M64 family metallopeptidase n=1 Tax=Parabacteroides pacaensis TaxID=2086575 RepID=UPI000D0E5473|nr:M64 family metallopeptidase [Parabacteroides pacaensis]